MKRPELDRYIANALSQSFFSANYVCLQDHTFVTIRSMEYANDRLKNCQTIEEALEAFICAWVKPEFQERMRAFCEIDTIAQRVKGHARLDCDYRTGIADTWSRASLYPTEWDDDGEVTHVLFTLTVLDQNQAQEVEDSFINKRALETIFDEIPGGIIVYEWNGTELFVKKISKYYLNKYGGRIFEGVVRLENFDIYPDDVEGFRKAIYKGLVETHELEYVFRALNKQTNVYEWTQVNAVAKPQTDGTALVYAMYTDVSSRMALIHSYRETMNALQKAKSDAMYMCDVNLTANTFANVQANEEVEKGSKQAKSLDEFVRLCANGVIDPEEKEKYLTVFSRENMLKRFEEGEHQFRLEHLYRDVEHTVMMESVYDLVRQPLTGEVVGIAYVKNLNEKKISNILLNEALRAAYPLAALVYTDTDEYYLYESGSGVYGMHYHDFWNKVNERVLLIVDNNKTADAQEEINKARILTCLEKHVSYTSTFSGTYQGQNGRYEVKFRYIDAKHHLMLATLRNITDEHLYLQYKYESEHDLLTGLYNRNTVFKKCKELMDTYPDKQFAISHLDIKHFHLYNTFFGEEAGDKLLCAMAEAVERVGKSYAHQANGRIEADVFCVFFAVDSDLFEKNLKQCFRELAEFSPDFPLEAAVGTYFITDTSMPIESMFSRATIAAKSNIKNLFGLVSLYDESMENKLKDTQQITAEMISAIEQEEFEVYLQPKYELDTAKLAGAEALVRWNHPVRGMVSPGLFIPVFEQNGFITELDKYMWDHVCRILRRWQDEGRPMYPISVNVSRVSMYSHLTVPFLKELVQKYGINTANLELELTESAYMDDPDDLQRELKELQDFGFRILMDDFGSGYSSLNTLRELPVDVLKLDMKFLRASMTDDRGLAVLSSVIKMSHLLKLPIVAEGVETKEQAEYLKSQGCEYVQGYLFGKPMPVAEYEKLLKRG